MREDGARLRPRSSLEVVSSTSSQSRSPTPAEETATGYRCTGRTKSQREPVDRPGVVDRGDGIGAGPPAAAARSAAIVHRRPSTACSHSSPRLTRTPTLTRTHQRDLTQCRSRRIHQLISVRVVSPEPHAHRALPMRNLTPGHTLKLHREASRPDCCGEILHQAPARTASGTVRPAPRGDILRQPDQPERITVAEVTGAGSGGGEILRRDGRPHPLTSRGYFPSAALTPPI